MDINKEREAYLKMLVGNDAISNDQADALKLMSGNSHFYTYGNQVSVAKLDLINWGWNSWVEAKSQAVPEVKDIGNELQSWVAVWSFKARHDREDYIVVDANLLAEKIEKLTGANA